jgi:hypothetical protein
MMNLDDILPLLSHEAEEFALKVEAFCKDTDGNFLQPVRLNHKEDRFYWCILQKKFTLINGNSEMYLFPWKKDKKGRFHVYCHHLFTQGTVVLIPQDEIIMVGFN